LIDWIIAASGYNKPTVKYHASIFYGCETDFRDPSALGNVSIGIICSGRPISWRFQMSGGNSLGPYLIELEREAIPCSLGQRLPGFCVEPNPEFRFERS
jgi:hypothetical protein